MEVVFDAAPIEQSSVDALVIGLWEQALPEGAAAAIDEVSGGLISRLCQSGELDRRRYALSPLWGITGLRVPLVLVVGLGPRDEWSPLVAFRAAAAASRWLAARPRARVGFYLDAVPAESTAELVAGAIVGCQGQDLYRSEKKRVPFQSLVWSSGEPALVDEGRILGECMNTSRRLVDEAPQEIFPESFAQHADRLARESGLACEIWGEDRLRAERMNALLAVGRSSVRPPRLVVLRHAGGADEAPPLVLAGKGVTFDSGGLSLKSTDAMRTMKMDMAGAATVLGAMQAIARLNVKRNVIGLMGLVENLPGPAAMKLGDVLVARNGKTIEVLNTDAEGRLVLADVLSLAVDLGAARIVDVATLTGACVVALGGQVAGVMSNDEPFCQQVLTAARAAGEPAWPLPMFALYADDVQSEVADLKNVGEGRTAGAIAAAKFLEAFVGHVPWVHLDVAGPAFLEKPTAWSDGGATAAMLRTLVGVARA